MEDPGHEDLTQEHDVKTTTLDTYNLITAERVLCEKALADAGSIVGAAQLLGITRHGLKRRIVKLGIRWIRGAVAGGS
jgi:transcriptional regulator with GAF, ATPase, and Fis domain